jgi:transcriptional regulator with XRE-family HTH domain
MAQRKGWSGMAGERAIRGQGLDRGGQADGNRGQASTRAWGAALRRMREARGWTQVELAQRMDYDPSVVSKLETGATTASEQHARAADRAFDTPGVFAAWLDDVVNGTHEPYERNVIELEENATILNVWEPAFVPGLLQTEEYMREVYLAGQPDASDEKIRQMIAARLSRQEIRERADPPPPMMHAVIWEVALRVPVGGPEVMHDQLKRLADAASHDRRVRVQVLPLGRGANAGMIGPFVVASFDAERPAAFMENILFGHITERRAEVARLALLFTTLAADALDTQASVDFIEKVAGEWRP